MLKDPRLEAIAQLVDWVEAHNARVVGGTGNERAAGVRPRAGAARRRGERRAQRPRGRRRVHVVEGDPSTPEGLLAALTNVELVPGPRLLVVRTLTPVAKLVNRARGNRRGRPPSATDEGDTADE